MRKARKNIIFSVLAVCMIFGGAELILRSLKHDYYRAPVEILEFSFGISGSFDELIKAKRFFGVISDEKLFWKFRPNYHLTTATLVEKRGVPTFAKEDSFTNSFGFRSPPIAIKKGEGVYRIACLGDSGTFGSGVSQEDPYPRQLESLLNQSWPEKKFEVINAGIPAYSSYQGRVLFRDVILALEPDLITLSFGANDAAKVPFSDIEQYERRQKFSQKIKWTLKKTELFSFLYYHYLVTTFGNGGRPNAKSDKKPRVSWKEFKENYRQIIKLARKKGIEVLILERNLFWPVESLPEKEVAAETGTPFIPIRKVLKKELEDILNGESHQSARKHYSDFYGPSIEEKPYLYLLIDHGHANALGHSVISRELFSRIINLENFSRYIK